MKGNFYYLDHPPASHTGLLSVPTSGPLHMPSFLTSMPFLHPFSVIIFQVLVQMPLPQRGLPWWPRECQVTITPSHSTLVGVCAKWRQSCPTLCDPMDCCPQGSLSTGFSRQDYWSGLPCPPPQDLSDPGIKPVCPMSTVLKEDSLRLSHQGSP